MTTIPDSYVLLQCAKCGHEADFFDFSRTPIGGDLPKGTHQCPNCKRAWCMEAQGKGELFASGLFIPPGRKAIAIPTIL